MRRQWTTGNCWLWCERAELPVLWLGPVLWEGGNAPLHACEGCIRRLESKIRSVLIRGASPPPTPERCQPAPGDCWLWCQRIALPTLLLGTAQSAGHQAPLYSCEPCIYRLEDKVRAALPYVPA
ncbi:hypothetical protein V2J94_46370 [Streptomyces sp. DSM 41524]|uniref:Uncharacterized protein n=1 Tax=Streptomyces asiaticus subsp. ignotus TaxID=3098222 RepID=A0ABU7QD15_9ACTN|nr:hypothetical protein [Streptomyces sp. DSM 41524]